MWFLKKKYKGSPIIETSNNILLPFNREIYLRIKEEALRKIRESKEKLSQENSLLK